MATFDLLLRGGMVIDGTGDAARRTDVGVRGDRIAAVGDLSAVEVAAVELVLDVTGRAVTPGFIDPHGHSDGSVFGQFDPGWSGIRISNAPSHPDWAGRSLADLADELGGDAADLAFDALIDDRLDVSIVLDCMRDDDVATIMAVPWIAVCTDAEGRRPGHPILDAGRPHPRTYGSTARVLGSFVRDRRVISLETAVAKLTSVPAERLGLPDRGVLREGAFADLVVFDPETVSDVATYLEPARYPIGIDHVIVNGRPAVLGGGETGERTGRLLRGG